MTEAELRPIVARNIAACRKQAGMTQAELAEKLNYSDKTISKWERAEGLPDLVVSQNIAELFGVPLDALRPGQHGTVAQLQLQGAMLQRLLDLGLTEDCPISCRLRAPAGDPAAYGIRGAVSALRSADAAGILVRLEGTSWPDETARRISPSP